MTCIATPPRRALRRLLLPLALLAAPSAALPAPAAPGDPIVRPGHWNKGKVPKGWIVITSEHYEVQCEAGEAKARALVDHLESVNACYQEFLPCRRKSETFVLKVFGTHQEFMDYSGQPPGVGAYYDRNSKELVGYDTGVILGKRDIPAVLSLSPECKASFTDTEKQRLAALFEAATDAYTMDTARILSHEGWHQYFHNYTVSIVTMPSWLDEGVGDYFFTATRDEQNSDGKHGYRLGDINENRVRALRRGLFEGSAVDFQTMLGYDQDQYYKNPSVCYAQGWSMVEFLLQNKDPARRELIPKLIKDFKDSKNFNKSTDKVFHGIDMAALDREWLGWVLSQPLSDPMLDLAREFGDRVKVEDLQGEERLTNLYRWYLDHPDFEREVAPEAPAAPAAPASN